MNAAVGRWAYVVADSGLADSALADVAGVGGRAVRPVRAAGLAAVVEDVDLDEFGEEALRRNLEDLDWLEATARRHHEVVRQVADRGPVVPLRLAAVFHDDPGVVRMLQARHDELCAALDTVGARAEWGVKVYSPERQAGETASTDDDERPGLAYLKKRRAELTARDEAAQAAIDSAAMIHTDLTDLATAAELRGSQSPELTDTPGRLVLNSAYLVDDAAADDFAAAVDRLAASHPEVTVELTGPWPPYSFASAAAADHGPQGGAR